MASGLKGLLQKHIERKNHSKSINANSAPFREEKVIKALPKEKSINKQSDEHDQCFILIPDVHSYMRDKKAFNLCMKSLPILAKSYNVTKFVQMGDLLECGIMSGHPATSVFEKVPEYSEEVQWAIDEFWKPAMKSCPNANFYALLGNHENRLNKKIAKDVMKGASLGSEIAIQIYNDLLPTDVYEELGIHVLPYGNESVTEGILQLTPKLICLHGWSTAKSASKVHLDLLSGGYSVVHGHTHRSQHYTNRNPMTGENVQAWSFGSLAKTEMGWHGGQPTNHVLGFGIVFVHGEDFTIQELSIAAKGSSRKLILPNGVVLIED
jgi:predicted phosphodiesterase